MEIKIVTEIQKVVENTKENGEIKNQDTGEILNKIESINEKIEVKVVENTKENGEIKNQDIEVKNINQTIEQPDKIQNVFVEEQKQLEDKKNTEIISDNNLLKSDLKKNEEILNEENKKTEKNDTKKNINNKIIKSISGIEEEFKSIKNNQTKSRNNCWNEPINRNLIYKNINNINRSVAYKNINKLYLSEKDDQLDFDFSFYSNVNQRLNKFNGDEIIILDKPFLQLDILQFIGCESNKSQVNALYQINLISSELYSSVIAMNIMKCLILIDFLFEHCENRSDGPFPIYTSFCEINDDNNSIELNQILYDHKFDIKTSAFIQLFDLLDNTFTINDKSKIKSSIDDIQSFIKFIKSQPEMTQEAVNFNSNLEIPKLRTILITIEKELKHIKYEKGVFLVPENSTLALRDIIEYQEGVFPDTKEESKKDKNTLRDNIIDITLVLVIAGITYLVIEEFKNDDESENDQINKDNLKIETIQNGTQDDKLRGLVDTLEKEYEICKESTKRIKEVLNQYKNKVEKNDEDLIKIISVLKKK